MAVWGQRTGETDYAPNSATDRVMRLCAELVTRFHPLRSPMPLVALRAAADQDDPVADAAVGKGVEFLRQSHLRRGLRCRVVEAEQDGDDFHRGLAVLRDLTGKPWESRHRPHSEPYVFPRSGLLRAIEQAVTADDEHPVLVRLERMRWRPRSADGDSDGWAQQALRTTMSPANLVGAAVAAALGALAAAQAGVVLGVLAGLLLVVVGSAWSRQYEGLLPWQGPAGRWLSTTTFLAAASDCPPIWSMWRPRLSRATRAARADEVAQIFRLAGSGPEGPERERARQYYLELRTLALLDDLRYNFRPRPVLRVRRHVSPPVVFIPRATRGNGAIALLRVISDVRSRRSELDPLLVVAGLTRADEAELHVRTVAAPAFTDPDTMPDPTALYWAWVRNHLRVGQSPSVAASLPWVLPIRLPVTLLTTTGTERHNTSPLGPPNWVRRAPRLVAGLAVMAMLTGASMYVGTRPENCDPVQHHMFDRDTEFEKGECYGISDGRVVFRPDGGVRLNGESEGKPGSGKGAGDNIGLAALMKSIKVENDEARAEKHVVVFYAGELTIEPNGDVANTALNGLRELAGVHAQQKAINDKDQVGDADWPKLVVEVANGGYGMGRQKEMVNAIIRYTREHPDEVIGVVGLSRDRESTDEAVKSLRGVGLNVVAPQNSDDELAGENLNYFGLAATNQEQAQAFQDAIDQNKVNVETGKALILTPRGEEDIYSRQQARDAQKALDETKLTARRLIYRDLEEVSDALCEWRPTVVYFTDRAEDLPDLTKAWKKTDCSPAAPLGEVALLTGDDLTKTLATKGREGVPDNVTIYYASLAAPKETLRNSNLRTDITKVVGGEAPGVEDPLFEDGTMALAYDATDLLYAAAHEADFEPNFINGSLLARKQNGAGGAIDLGSKLPGRRSCHTVAIFRVGEDAKGHRQTSQAYYRKSGNTVAGGCHDGV